jgi:hypothetical protein
MDIIVGSNHPHTTVPFAHILLMADLSRRVLVSHREVVRAPATMVWSLLLEKIRSPEKYVPGVTDVSVLREWGTHFVERKMKAGPSTMHEIISADPNVMSVVFRTHASHPVLSGFVSNTVLPDPTTEEELAGRVDGKEPDTCLLDFTMNLTAKSSMPQEAFEAMREKMGDAIVKAVQTTKKHAEVLNKTDEGE